MLKDDVIRGLLELVDAGYPESVAKRIASGELPMDNASRMARAAEQGYDMTPQYHGSQSDILEFRPSSDGKMGAGVYTSDNPEVANRYASGISGDNVTPLLLRGQSINRKDAIAANPDMRREPGETNRDMFQRLANIVQGGGYDRMDIGGPAQGNMIRESVTYNPENIRSLLSAAFDPEYKGKNILGASAGAGTAGLLGAGAMQSENAAAESLSDEDRYMRDVETARQMAASEDPAIQQRGTAWLERHGNLIDDKADQKMFGRTSVLDQPLWLAQAGETAIRDILGIPAGIYSPELGDRIREERLLPATKGTDYYDEQVSGALGEALTPFIAGASKLAKMPFDAATAMYAANPSAMAMPVQGLPSESGSLTDVISSASEEYDKMTEEQKRNVKRLGYGLDAASYFPPVYGLMKLIGGAK